ncbi:MATH and LRR domain-containing protein PFE0570w-like isoform X2 [Harmonia axyridis]|uniref:MATH and LRR domain-containing protein PFE0570w-like isoform X2 n=1 Tax=Harmonia axyridis TaxID=115357 RepID=UPI001E2765EB|nr:MATH and LRR domain-containing protein PFE0570w-like isoform X2 [Harmonia axyridis]
MSEGIFGLSYSLNLSFNDKSPNNSNCTESCIKYVKINKDNTIQTNSASPLTLIESAVPPALQNVLNHYGVQAKTLRTKNSSSLEVSSQNIPKESSAVNDLTFSIFKKIQEDSDLNSTACQSSSTKQTNVPLKIDNQKVGYRKTETEKSTVKPKSKKRKHTDRGSDFKRHENSAGDSLDKIHKGTHCSNTLSVSKKIKIYQDVVIKSADEGGCNGYTNEAEQMVEKYQYHILNSCHQSFNRDNEEVNRIQLKVGGSMDEEQNLKHVVQMNETSSYRSENVKTIISHLDKEETRIPDSLAESEDQIKIEYNERREKPKKKHKHSKNLDEIDLFLKINHQDTSFIDKKNSKVVEMKTTLPELPEQIPSNQKKTLHISTGKNTILNSPHNQRNILEEPNCKNINVSWKLDQEEKNDEKYQFHTALHEHSNVSNFEVYRKQLFTEDIDETICGNEQSNLNNKKCLEACRETQNSNTSPEITIVREDINEEEIKFKKVKDEKTEDATTENVSLCRMIEQPIQSVRKYDIEKLDNILTPIRNSGMKQGNSKKNTIVDIQEKTAHSRNVEINISKETEIEESCENQDKGQSKILSKSDDIKEEKAKLVQKENPHQESDIQDMINANPNKNSIRTRKKQQMTTSYDNGENSEGKSKNKLVDSILRETIDVIHSPKNKSTEVGNDCKIDEIAKSNDTSSDHHEPVENQKSIKIKKHKKLFDVNNEQLSYNNNPKQLNSIEKHQDQSNNIPILLETTISGKTIKKEVRKGILDCQSHETIKNKIQNEINLSENAVQIFHEGRYIDEFDVSESANVRSEQKKVRKSRKKIFEEIQDMDSKKNQILQIASEMEENIGDSKQKESDNKLNSESIQKTTSVDRIIKKGEMETKISTPTNKKGKVNEKKKGDEGSTKYLVEKTKNNKSKIQLDDHISNILFSKIEDFFKELDSGGSDYESDKGKNKKVPQIKENKNKINNSDTEHKKDTIIQLKSDDNLNTSTLISTEPDFDNLFDDVDEKLLSDIEKEYHEMQSCMTPERTLPVEPIENKCKRMKYNSFVENSSPRTKQAKDTVIDNDDMDLEFSEDPELEYKKMQSYIFNQENTPDSEIKKKTNCKDFGENHPESKMIAPSRTNKVPGITNLISQSGSNKIKNVKSNSYGNYDSEAEAVIRDTAINKRQSLSPLKNHMKNFKILNSNQNFVDGHTTDKQEIENKENEPEKGTGASETSIQDSTKSSLNDSFINTNKDSSSVPAKEIQKNSETFIANECKPITEIHLSDHQSCVESDTNTEAESYINTFIQHSKLLMDIEAELDDYADIEETFFKSDDDKQSQNVSFDIEKCSEENANGVVLNKEASIKSPKKHKKMEDKNENNKPVKESSLGSKITKIKFSPNKSNKVGNEGGNTGHKYIMHKFLEENSNNISNAEVSIKTPKKHQKTSTRDTYIMHKFLEENSNNTSNNVSIKTLEKLQNTPTEEKKEFSESKCDRTKNDEENTQNKINGPKCRSILDFFRKENIKTAVYENKSIEDPVSNETGNNNKDSLPSNEVQIKTNIEKTSLIPGKDDMQCQDENSDIEKCKKETTNRVVPNKGPSLKSPKESHGISNENDNTDRESFLQTEVKKIIFEVGNIPNTCIVHKSSEEKSIKIISYDEVPVKTPKKHQRIPVQNDKSSRKGNIKNKRNRSPTEVKSDNVQKKEEYSKNRYIPNSSEENSNKIISDNEVQITPAVKDKTSRKSSIKNENNKGKISGKKWDRFKNEEENTQDKSDEPKCRSILDFFNKENGTTAVHKKELTEDKIEENLNNVISINEFSIKTPKKHQKTPVQNKKSSRKRNIENESFSENKCDKAQRSSNEDMKSQEGNFDLKKSSEENTDRVVPNEEVLIKSSKKRQRISEKKDNIIKNEIKKIRFSLGGSEIVENEGDDIQKTCIKHKSSNEKPNEIISNNEVSVKTPKRKRNLSVQNSKSAVPNEDGLIRSSKKRQRISDEKCKIFRKSLLESEIKKIKFSVDKSDIVENEVDNKSKSSVDNSDEIIPCNNVPTKTPKKHQKTPALNKKKIPAVKDTTSEKSLVKNESNKKKLSENKCDKVENEQENTQNKSDGTKCKSILDFFKKENNTTAVHKNESTEDKIKDLKAVSSKKDSINSKEILMNDEQKINSDNSNLNSDSNETENNNEYSLPSDEVRIKRNIKKISLIPDDTQCQEGNSDIRKCKTETSNRVVPNKGLSIKLPKKSNGISDESDKTYRKSLLQSEIKKIRFSIDKYNVVENEQDKSSKKVPVKTPKKHQGIPVQNDKSSTKGNIKNKKDRSSSEVKSDKDQKKEEDSQNRCNPNSSEENSNKIIPSNEVQITPAVKDKTTRKSSVKNESNKEKISENKCDRVKNEEENTPNKSNGPKCRTILDFFKKENSMTAVHKKESTEDKIEDLSSTSSRRDLCEEVGVPDYSNLNSDSKEHEGTDEYSFADILSQINSKKLEKEFHDILGTSSKLAVHEESSNPDDILVSPKKSQKKCGGRKQTREVHEKYDDEQSSNSDDEEFSDSDDIPVSQINNRKKSGGRKQTQKVHEKYDDDQSSISDDDQSSNSDDEQLSNSDDFLVPPKNSRKKCSGKKQAHEVHDSSDDDHSFNSDVEDSSNSDDSSVSSRRRKHYGERKRQSVYVNSDDEESSNPDDMLVSPMKRRKKCGGRKQGFKEKAKKEQAIKLMKQSKSIWEIQKELDIYKKDELQKKVENLVIKNPYPLSRIQEIIPITSYYVGCRQRLSDEGITLKLGPFSEKEDEMIKTNWKDFCQQINWDENDYLPFVSGSAKSKYGVLSLKQFESFVQWISHDFENRTMNTVFDRFRSIYLFKELDNGRYDEVDDQVIEEYLKVNDSSTPFLDIGTILNRQRRSVRLRHRLLEIKKKYSNQKIHWTKSLVEKLIVTLTEETCTINLLELKDHKITSLEWLKVAERMNLPPDNIRRSWLSNLYPRFFSDVYTEHKGYIRAKLIDIVSSSYPSWKEVDWKAVSEKMGEGFPPITCRKTLHDLVRNKVPSVKKNDFKKALEHLKNIDLEPTKDYYSFVKEIWRETKNGTILPRI